jgi:hypothetical protein
VILIEASVFFLALIAFGQKEAVSYSLILLLPSMWWARLKVAKLFGVITARFKFMAALGIPTTFIIWNPDRLDRKFEADAFNSYVLRESIYCTFLSVFLLANTVLPKIVQIFQ